MVAKAKAVLTIPGPPPVSANRQERMHWAQRNRVRDWWSKQAWHAWMEAGGPRFERAAVRYRLYYKTRRNRDDDNAIYACKPILDGLKGHAFGDDDASTVTILPPVIDVDSDKPRVEIEISEIGETT